MTEHAAKSLLANEAFQDAVQKTQQAYLNAAMNCAQNDDEGRRLNLSAARIVGQIAAHLAALTVNKDQGQVIELPDFYQERAKARFNTWASVPNART